jgi:two-component system, LuxR family, response regulator FixJ
MVVSTATRPIHHPEAGTVFIVDDDADVRRSVSLLVRSIGLADDQYASGKEFLDRYDPDKPGCLVLDVRMPGISGLELQQGLSSRAIYPPIIFVTAHGEIPLATQAIRAGAVDFIQKPFSPQALLDRIREALEIDRNNRRKSALADQVQGRMSQLTAREHEIMPYLARGDSTKQIAHRLAISPKTVDNHRASILQKMNVDNPAQLAHLIAPPSDVDP